MEYPQIERYFALDSPIHRWDPRLKLLSFFLFALSAVLLPDIKLAFAAFCFAIIMLGVSRLPFHFILSYLKWLFMFMLFFFIIMPFTISGKEIFSFWHFEATYEGFKTALLISLRALSVAILMFVMLATTKFEKIIKAMEKLKFPNKLLQILMLSYRYIFVFISEAQRTWNALNLRGFKMGRFPSIYTLKALGKVIAILFVRGYERSERVYNAMIVRGYSGNIETLEDFEMKGRDLIGACVVMGLGISLHCLSLAI